MRRSSTVASGAPTWTLSAFSPSVMVPAGTAMPLARKVVAMAAISTPALAQERPSFAGQWSRELGPPRDERDVSGYTDLGSGWGDRITVTQDSARLTIEYAFFSRGDLQPPLKFVYALDGTETRNNLMMGRGIQRQTSKVRWSDGRLVIATAHAFTQDGKAMTSEVTQTLSLESPMSASTSTT